MASLDEVNDEERRKHEADAQCVEQRVSPNRLPDTVAEERENQLGRAENPQGEDRQRQEDTQG